MNFCTEFSKAQVSSMWVSLIELYAFKSSYTQIAQRHMHITRVIQKYV